MRILYGCLSVAIVLGVYVAGYARGLMGVVRVARETLDAGGVTAADYLKWVAKREEIKKAIK